MKIVRLIMELAFLFLCCFSVISPDVDVRYVIYFSTMYLGIVIRNMHQEGDEEK